MGIIRVLVGRACRFRLGRKLFGPKGDADYRVQRLDSDILGIWGNYLGIPPENLKLPEEGNYLLVAFHGRNVVGHVSVFRQWFRTDIALQGWWLTGLEVVPSWRGRGVGRELVRRIIDLWGEDHPGESLFLVVNRRNEPAISLFELMGFACTQRADWETKLRKPYPQVRRGTWAYRLMEKNCRKSYENYGNDI